jgi:hypothetical protein
MVGYRICGFDAIPLVRFPRLSGLESFGRLLNDNAQCLDERDKPRQPEIAEQLRVVLCLLTIVALLGGRLW